MANSQTRTADSSFVTGRLATGPAELWSRAQSDHMFCRSMAAVVGIARSWLVGSVTTPDRLPWQQSTVYSFVVFLSDLLLCC